MSSACAFAINGRFLTQPMTGVQRYALTVVKGLDSAGDLAGAPVLVPPGAPGPKFVSLERMEIGSGFGGHAWEQCILPLQWKGPLLNLGNTAPIAKAEQIICIHDANVFAAPDSYSRAFRTAYQQVQPRLVKKASRITTVSQTSARQIARYLPIDAKDIVVLPNGHEHALEWRADAAKLAPEIVSAIAERDRRYVFALGSKAKHKNLALLLGIAGELDALGVDIVVAGGEFSIFRQNSVEGVQNVHFVGRVSDDDLAYFLKHALCLAFPSFNEGFGLPIIEAMALGCPVVSSSQSSMVEICGDAALMASPFHPAQWVPHIAGLLQSQSMADDLRARAFGQIRNFSWADTTAGYRDLMLHPQRNAHRQRPTSRLPSPKLAVVVATRGRPQIVSCTVRHLLASQTIMPAVVVLACVEPADAGDLALDPRITLVCGKAGSSAQRNNALDHLPADTDIVVFLDDDFIADRNWLAAAAQAFADESEIVALTGHVVADGIKGPGISFEEALAILDRPVSIDKGQGWERGFSPYGCNMAFRFSSIGSTRFDERLVLYGWLEDRDFGASVASRGGQMVKCSEAFGVHMGVKISRSPGERLGYSQAINPIYLCGKGTMTLGQALSQIWRNVSMNLVRSLSPEPFIDRRGRVKGNILGLCHLLRGRVEPERAALLGHHAIGPENLMGNIAR